MGKDAKWWWNLIWGVLLLGALGGMTAWLAIRGTAMWNVLKRAGGG
jgi:hypothetical protein